MLAVLIEAGIRSLLLCTVVWIALGALRIRNPHILKTIWTAVLLASLAMPFLMQWTLIPIEATPALLVQVTESGSAALSLPPAAWQSTLGWVYAAVAAILLSQFVVGFVRTFRRWLDARPIAESWADGSDIRTSSEIMAPATFGSTILLPSEYVHWSPVKRAAVLSHERMHVRERDSYTQWFAVAHRALFWFNPAAWWLKRQLALLAETTSDAAAMAELNDRTAYAEILLDVARFGTSTPEVVSIANRSLLSQRVEQILSKSKLPVRPARALRALAVALLLPGIAVFAGISVSSAAVPQKKGTDNSASQHSNEREIHMDDETQAMLLETGPLMRFYPAEAAQKGIEGFVTCRVTVDSSGRGVEVEVISESPVGHGLGAAAVALLKDAKYTANRPSQITTNVKFELKPAAGESGPTGTM